jgi:pyruvate,water dikinase
MAITEAPASHDGFDTETNQQARWTTAGIIEMLPGVLPPLVWDVNRALVEEAFRQLFDQMRVLPDDIDERGGFVGRFRGRAALSLDAMAATARSMPGGSETDIEQQYFGIAAGNRALGTKPARRGVRGVVHDMMAARERREATVEAETVIEAWSTLGTTTPNLVEPSDDGLLAYRRGLLDFGGRAMAAELAVSAAAVASYRRLELTLLERLDPKEASSWLVRLTSGVGRRPRAGAARDQPASRAIFAGPTSAEGDGAQGWTPTSAESVRPSRTELDDKAWYELIARLRKAPNWNAVRAMTGQVADVRLIVLRRLIEDTNELLERREATKDALLALGGEVRRVHLEFGRRLVARGALEHVGDVDLLAEREYNGTSPMPSRLELPRRRQWLDDRGAEPLLPQRFRGTPPTVALGEVGAAVLHGWPAAAGRHTGRARLLDEPDPTQLDLGDVLVARVTDSSWTPVFLRAGAVVLEQGGPLSHAAVVARELGLPAVLNVPGVTSRVSHQECTVTVDGDDGVVVVHEDRADAG